jgi:tetratricopeptide (TPR) repeat protein
VKTTPRAIKPLSLVFVLWIWAAPALCRAPQTKAPRAEDQLNEGIQLFGKGRLKEAVAAFDRFKQTAPQDPRPYFYSGMALTEAGELSRAASELQEAVSLSPDQPEYRLYQANVFAQLKQKDAALGALGIFTKQDEAEQLPASWLLLLAEVYLRLDKIDDSSRILDLCGSRYPNDPRVYFDRGKVYVALGRLDLALESFRKSIEKSTDNLAAYFELGKLLYQRNELPAAKEALLEALKRDRTNPEYLYNLGVVCLARDEVDEAVEYLKRAEPSAAAFPEIYFALGRAYQKKNDRTQGEAYRKKFQDMSVVRREKEDRDRLADRFIAQGERQLDQGNTAEARALFEQAVQADPKRWDPHGYLAEMFLSSGDLEHAYLHLVKMEEIDPDSVVGNFLMAKYWYGRKDFERALGYAEKVESSRPGNSELRNLLGNIYVGLGQNERALQEYEAAVHLAPDRADFRENLRRAETARPQLNQDSLK